MRKLSKTKIVGLLVIVSVLAVTILNIGKTSAEQIGDSPDSGVSSKIKQAYDSLVILSYGSDSAGDWGDWGEFWNRIRSSAEWTPDGTVTADQVMAGETFYGDSRTKQTGTLALVGDAEVGDVAAGMTFYSDTFGILTGTLALTGDVTASDVVAGKTFYSDSFSQQTGTLALTGDALAENVVAGKTFYSDTFNIITGTLALTGDADPSEVFSGRTFYNDSLVQQTGTWSFSGDATVGDVASGKTFYSDSSTLLTGTASLGIDYEEQSLDEYDDHKGLPDNPDPQDYQGEESNWTNTSANVWKDERTGLYWTSNQGGYTNSFPNSDHSSCDYFALTDKGSYSGADSDCGNAINLCGALSQDKDGDSIADTTWYLPTMKEFLQSYIDGIYNQTGGEVFVTKSLYWTSTEVSYSSDQAWYVYQYLGNNNISPKGAVINVRCVSR